MNIRETIFIGYDGLMSHKLRTFLTMLGIIFGIAAVIAMLSIGEGAKQQALDQISLLGVQNIIIKYVEPEKDPDSDESLRGTMGLTLEDGRAIESIVDSVVMTSVQKNITAPLKERGKTVEANIMGVTPNYSDLMSLNLSKGSFFTDSDMESARRLCVIGGQIARTMFPLDNPMTKQIKIGDQWFRVIGITAGMKTSEGDSAGIALRNMNRDIYIPLTAARKRFPSYQFENRYSEVDVIIAKTAEGTDTRKIEPVINKIMKRRHHDKEDFTIIVPEALIQQSQQTQRIFNIVMGCIAGLSLLVGGIGIMNIMLASVFERTREIGVRRAVGAMGRDILGQFLVEAVIMSVFGGLLGVITGFTMTKIITYYAEWKTIISFSSIMLAFGVSAAVGVIFGIYPAFRAASQDPIEALRYE